MLYEVITLYTHGAAIAGGAIGAKAFFYAIVGHAFPLSYLSTPRIRGAVWGADKEKYDKMTQNARK